MLKNVWKNIKKQFNKEVNIYYGDLIVSSVEKRAIDHFKDYNRICFEGLNYGNLVTVDIVLKNLPYLDDDIPDTIKMDKNYQITEILYVLNGVRTLYRTNRELPALMKFENGQIIEEEYPLNRFNVKMHQGYSSYTIPKKIIYENGSIKDDGSFWSTTPDNQKEIDIINFDHKEYREIIKDALEIDINNFKNFTYTERMLINLYMNTECYKFKLESLGIKATKESIKENIEILKMIYI